MSGGTGVPGSLCAVSLGIRPSLLRALSSNEAPAERRALRQFHGCHPVTRPEASHQDDLILEVRRLYEQIGLPPLAIHSYITHLGHIRSLGWVRQTTQYYNRSHLVPTPNAAPYISTPTSEGR